jgi:hypothetical protein
MPSKTITKYLLHQTSKMTRKHHHEIHGGFLYKNEDYTYPYTYSVANNQSNLLVESQKLTVPGIHHKIVEIGTNEGEVHMLDFHRVLKIGHTAGTSGWKSSSSSVTPKPRFLTMT